MTTALFIGRFQPFHNGHLAVIKQIIEKHSFVIIVIGSTQHENSVVNPFSVSERRRMIELTMASEKIVNYKILEVPDINDYGQWVNHVKKHVSMANLKFDVVYTGSEITKRLFEEAEDKVEWVKERINCVSSTEIRFKITNKEDWQEMVPNPVFDYIKEINGEGRIRHLN
ncbi:nicotinamide-nucleotide adenylyltransferase [Candidatus Woesearchaeota archaeon]|jgi:nicotinamide-nucleotide adenylyltransferase|nr:nicotinamide-nucleotide adenylyltransferase [Candidatus Woesearchaeota archaeon]MBT5272356.1 nicotinamide-nucleotide adenylyltransferase [Candidatus Woesearchaeota archaeon]MBT6336628.1 nicotinamide-nucleotide adenylyltransferase [Candidatus Woesearchaeota archaeon]MBT7927518.1 nicotinamide-nucleotide adenylyltransferase [Candidatus Woesearchaeota archaeon]